MIETLVVLLVLSILAAIALSFFLSQRESASASQARATLSAIAQKAESYRAANEGVLWPLDGADSTIPNAAYRQLEEEGLLRPESVNVFLTVTGGGEEFCARIIHTDLPGGHPWREATLDSSDPAPVPITADAC